MSDIRTVPVSALVLDRELQPRAQEYDHLIREYANAMRAAGAKFPPLVCFDVKGRGLLLADGWHRLRARQRLGQTVVEVEVRQGDFDDALLFSREYNSMHGARFTTVDKQRAIMTYLNHARFTRFPDREIARRLGVDHKSVGKYRAEMDGVSQKRKTPDLRGNSPIIVATPLRPETRKLAEEGDRLTREVARLQADEGLLNAAVAAERARHEAASRPDETPSETPTEAAPEHTGIHARISALAMSIFALEERLYAVKYACEELSCAATNNALKDRTAISWRPELLAEGEWYDCEQTFASVDEAHAFVFREVQDGRTQGFRIVESDDPVSHRWLGYLLSAVGSAVGR